MNGYSISFSLEWHKYPFQTDQNVFLASKNEMPCVLLAAKGINWKGNVPSNIQNAEIDCGTLGQSHPVHLDHSILTFSFMFLSTAPVQYEKKKEHSACRSLWSWARWAWTNGGSDLDYRCQQGGVFSSAEKIVLYLSFPGADNEINNQNVWLVCCGSCRQQQRSLVLQWIYNATFAICFF